MALTDESVVDALRKVLAGETDTFRQLVTVSERERTAIRTDDLTSLAMMTRAKKKLVKELGRLERRRVALVGELAGKAALSKDVTLAELLPHLDDAGELSAHGEALAVLVERTLALNHANRLLLESELRHIDATVAYLVAGDAGDVHYSPKGDYMSSSEPESGTGQAGTVLNRKL